MPPTINPELCNGCKSCVEICPAGVLAMEEDKARVVNPDSCTECRACEAACPNGAISFG